MVGEKRQFSQGQANENDLAHLWMEDSLGYVTVPKTLPYLMNMNSEELNNC